MEYIGYALVLIHLVLLGWSVGGFAEMLFSTVPWTPYTNLDFPKWLLPIHWGSVVMASVGFLLGYLTRWSGTPTLMLAAYTLLFTLCVVETFGFMTNAGKYVAMVSELVAYVVILELLFRSPYFVGYFGGVG